ncbi:6,7-dimethyl-8-ribityllumazine synthase [Chlamydia pecorum]|uniref:6,7-dimethyl-8-ribityllumazine synthase n=1 Tax=Chlamydia pecorum TaxID=85991 RepID=UPI0003D3E14F|nr:6,7-dimethyl-8-ribityllumazine synthase [Chlamydia pecorum]ETF38542.1 6,7-dimethyl-8-ribityllumazine synthase [Chlamydia pecorum VR629]
MKIYRGNVSAKGLRIAIVGSCFNLAIADALVSGAQDTFIKYGGDPELLTTVRVPGAFEIPCTVKKLLLSFPDQYHAIVTCGVLIRGETTHYDHIADQVSAGVAKLSLDFCIPITFSIITAPDPATAWERAGIKGGHIGSSGMVTAIEMATLFSQIS